VPALIPLSIFALAVVAESMGHQWNIHGDLGSVIVLIIFTSAIAFVMQLLALRIAIPRLHRGHAEGNYVINWLCTAFAAICVAVCVFGGVWLIVAIFKIIP